MKQTLIIQAANDHVRQWAAFKRLYVKKRQSDAGRHGMAIPRTTNDDVRQLVTYWHGQYLHELLNHRKSLDKDLASRKRWIKSKHTLHRQLSGAESGALYPANEWFWQDASRGLAIYLESRKAVPTRVRLVIEAIEETVSEDIANVVEMAEETGIWPVIKRGAIVVGGLTATAIAIPLMVRMFKD